MKIPFFYPTPPHCHPYSLLSLSSLPLCLSTSLNNKPISTIGLKLLLLKIAATHHLSHSHHQMSLDFFGFSCQIAGFWLANQVSLDFSYWVVGKGGETVCFACWFSGFLFQVGLILMVVGLWFGGGVFFLNFFIFLFQFFEFFKLNFFFFLGRILWFLVVFHVILVGY